MDVIVDILKDIGFRSIGEISYQFSLSIWWHEEKKIQVIVFQLGSKILIRGNKSYFLKSISEEGETWAREIPRLHDYLEAHFPELHISFSHFRDITQTLAASQIDRKLSAQTPSIQAPTVQMLSRLQQTLRERQRDLQSTETFLEFQSDRTGMLGSNETKRANDMRREIATVEDRIAETQERLKLFSHLQKEYVAKGSAACFMFSLSSNLHLTDTPSEFQDSLIEVVKELEDAHRYQVTQKLHGGKLNIQVDEATEPALVWIEEWLGGGLSPKQLGKLAPEFSILNESSNKLLMVTPNEDIQIEGHVKESRKRMAAHVVSSLIGRLDIEEQLNSKLREPSVEAYPANLGLIMRGAKVTDAEFLFPLAKQVNGYISGSTGSGKSYLGRVIVEEATKYKSLKILVLDPRNQAAGLLVPEDRDSVLSMYSAFGMKASDSRGFDFDYFAPGQSLGNQLPSDLSRLGYGRSIVSFKGMDDSERCETFCDILDSVFESYTDEESEKVELLIVIEEAQRFTKKRVDEKAKKSGERAENTLDKIAREIRKYGGCIIILSQTIRDFSYDSASIRQNTNTKFFMHNSDREVDYAANYIGDGKEIIKLTPGTVIVYDSSFGAVKVKVRPPLSKVWEFNAHDTARIVSDEEKSSRVLSADASKLLESIRSAYAESGRGLNLSEASKRSGITSKRALQTLLDELELGGFVRTRKLAQRGQPRIIEPISSESVDEIVD